MQAPLQLGRSKSDHTSDADDAVANPTMSMDTTVPPAVSADLADFEVTAIYTSLLIEHSSSSKPTKLKFTRTTLPATKGSKDKA